MIITRDELQSILDEYGLEVRKTSNVMKNLGRTPVLVLATALNNRVIAQHHEDLDKATKVYLGYNM